MRLKHLPCLAGENRKGARICIILTWTKNPDDNRCRKFSQFSSWWRILAFKDWSQNVSAYLVAIKNIRTKVEKGYGFYPKGSCNVSSTAYNFPRVNPLTPCLYSPSLSSLKVYMRWQFKVASEWKVTKIGITWKSN